MSVQTEISDLSKDIPKLLETNGLHDLPEENENFIALDTVDGLKAVRDITLDEIEATAARATTHDFDLSSYLLLIKKLQPNIHIRIIGVPMGSDAKTVLPAIIALL